MANGLENHSRASNSATLWSRARIAARSLKVSFMNATSDDPTITSDGEKFAKPKASSSYLHRYCQDQYATGYKQKRDQGKVARAISNTTNMPPAPHGSTTVQGCGFAIGDSSTEPVPTPSPLTPTKAAGPTPYQPVANVVTTTKPCHCPPNVTAIRERHNKIVQRVSKAIHRGTVALDQQISDGPNRDRADIVVRDGNRVTIVDVVCPFENDTNARQDAAQRKVTKYEYLIPFFEQQDLRAKGVGSLGSWHPENEAVLNEE